MPDEPRLRPMRDGDVDTVLRLNEAHVELLAPMDEARLAQLQAWGGRVDILQVGADVAGFVVTFGPGSPYDSENYRWFAARYDTGFRYLDRIVVDGAFQRRGHGGFVYDVVEREAAPYGRLALEVNLDPPNVGSLAFHAARGFVEVGRLGDPGHVVSLMLKPLS